MNVVEERLDAETFRQWESSLDHDEFATLDELCLFMEKRCRSLRPYVEDKSSSKLNAVPTKKPSIRPSASMSTFHTSTSASCVVCGASHIIESCPKFLNMNVFNRIKALRQRRLCFKCLKARHQSTECDQATCSQCSGKHHELIHFNRSSTGKSSTDTSSTAANDTTVVSHFGNRENQSPQVLLSTALVMEDGSDEKLRVLLDSGSQASFIAENCAQRLRLCRKRTSVPINGLGVANAGRADARVNLKIRSNVDHIFVLEVEALVLKKLTNRLPNHEILPANRPKFMGISLADPQYYMPGEIDMLIGSDVYGKLLADGLIRAENGTTAQNTSLGWIISGPIQNGHQTTPSCGVALISMHLQIETDLRRFWEIEEVGVANPLTSEEEICEKHFTDTHIRDTEGRYVVKLPFKATTSELGNSRSAAVKRLLQMERRLSNRPQLKNEYVSFMREYSALGHMELAKTKCWNDATSYYLPHHCVLKESSSTTKLRVVFDASCKTSSGISLNEKQLIGPKLQDDLFRIILRFRRHLVAMTADIAKMYRQVRVHPEDQQFQKIVWREDPKDDIQDWLLTTVTYGMAAAPYLAIRSLRQLAVDEYISFPNACKVVLSDFYVDDMITGCDNVNEAIELQAELRMLLSRGGFELRKWSSNNTKILVLIPVDDRESKLPLNLSDDSAVNALGLHWYPSSDSFGFQVKLPNLGGPITKRSILSTVARLFDPLGFLSPTIVLAKIMLQQLWTAGVTWDEEVSSDIAEKWLNYRNTLSNLEALRIPRWIGIRREQKCQIHAFCDASESAYGAVVYARSESADGTVAIQFITAKTKVAPIQQITVPRLELCAAVLLSKLLAYVGSTLNLEEMDYYAWSDSQVVLAWIRKLPRQWKTFVANRVSFIQSSTSPDRWRYVPSASNPADCASRGVMPSDLAPHPLWFNGPEWLKKDASCWPEMIPAAKVETEVDEKPSVTVLSATTITNWSLLDRYSDLRTLRRVTAYVLRFVWNAKNGKSKRKIGLLSTSELKKALHFWIKRDQRSEFSAELKCCRDGSNLPKKSRLNGLIPFIDKDGLLRVGGRVKSANIPVGEAHQIILPDKSILTNLIIADNHIKLLHGGVQLMLGYVRNKYWILNARSRMRQYIHRCMKCYRQKPKPCQQLMGDLPPERVTPSRPFLRTGVDYAGPILVKNSTGRGSRTSKAYICLFVCFSTKAVHLETVSDMTTKAFLAAYRRFTARRGHCADMFSDCGTYFVGAQRELGKLLEHLRSKEHNELISRTLTNDGTNWHLIPPGSPHIGGLWEAGVKSVKHHLKRFIGENKLTFEEFATTLAEIEACLNSRPLCAQTDDPDDNTALTPGHFLIGEPMELVPEPNLTSIPVNRLDRWKLMKQMTQHFWYRWHKEYLLTLQERPKWQQSQSNVEVGRLVVVKDERLPPAKWMLARIIETHPGRDGRIRVVTLRCNNGTTKRSIHKICVLPVE